jgi:MFS family permease
MVFSNTNGVNTILGYAPTIFLEAGISDVPDAILNSVFVNGWITVCTVAAFWLTRTFGRRPILICGTFAMAVGHVLMFLVFTYHASAIAMLFAMLVPTAAYTLTLAPLSWVVLSEIFPNRVRGKAMSLATCIMFAFNYAASNAFPVLLDWFRNRYGNPGGTFLIFTVICLAGMFFIWLMIPETKDKSLEDIGRSWLRKDAVQPAK